MIKTNESFLRGVTALEKHNASGSGSSPAEATNSQEVSYERGSEIPELGADGSSLIRLLCPEECVHLGHLGGGVGENAEVGLDSSCIKKFVISFRNLPAGP